jgi:outer membrane receptor for Fe3+-dicitrate
MDSNRFPFVFTTGGGSVLYGPGGNGGAINIITKSGKKGLYGSIAGEAGEGEGYLAKGSLSGAGGNAAVYAAVKVMDRDKFPLANDFVGTDEQDGAYRDNSDWQRTNLFGNLGYRLTDKTRLGLAVRHLTGENGKPPVTNYDRDDPFTKRVKYERIDDIESSLVQLAFDHQTAGPFQIRGWGFFSQSDVEENRVNRNGDAQNFADDRDMQVYSAVLKYEQALGERVGFVRSIVRAWPACWSWGRAWSCWMSPWRSWTPRDNPDCSPSFMT